MKWIKKLFAPKEAYSPVALAEAVLEETEEILQESESLMWELNNLSVEENSSMEWFLSLPEYQKRIVEECRKAGIDVNAENLQSVLEQIAASGND